MPWDVFERDDEWCVYRVDTDGEPVGDTFGCHATKAEAEAQQRALYANVEEPGVTEMHDESLNQRVERIRTKFTSIAPRIPPEGEYFWVADVFEDYVIVRRGDKAWRVAMTVTDEDVQFVPSGEWEEVTLEYVPVSETDRNERGVVKETISTTMLSEFRGAFPNVSVAAGVDYDALVQGDDDPMFLTVPVARVGDVSENGLVHDRGFAVSLVEQVNRDRPEGLMGHLRDDERSTAYPVSAIHWIGATLVDSVVWAKGYIPRTRADVREEYRIAKAKGGKVATSVYGQAVREFVAESPKWYARDFDLEHIDLAPYKRAAWKGSGEFYLTRETTHTQKQEEIPMTTKTEILAGLTVRDLPEALKTEVLKEFEVSRRVQAQIAELTVERDSLKTRVSELEGERDKLQAEIKEFKRLDAERVAAEAAQQFELALNARIAEFVSWGDDTRVKEHSDRLRKQFKRAVLAELGDDRDAAHVEKVLTTLWTEDFQPLAETLRDALAGPAAVVSGRVSSTHAKVDDSPEAIRAAREKFGI